VLKLFGRQTTGQANIFGLVTQLSIAQEEAIYQLRRKQRKILSSYAMNPSLRDGTIAMFWQKDVATNLRQQPAHNIAQVDCPSW